MEGGLETGGQLMASTSLATVVNGGLTWCHTANHWVTADGGHEAFGSCARPLCLRRRGELSCINLNCRWMRRRGAGAVFGPARAAAAADRSS